MHMISNTLITLNKYLILSVLLPSLIKKKLDFQKQLLYISVLNPIF